MKTKILIIISLLFFNVTAQQQNHKQNKEIENLINKGLEAYDNADYSDAEVNFRKALAKDPLNAVASYNLGLTETEMEKNLEGAHFFEKAAQQTDDPLLKSKAYFNEGNIWYQKKKYDKAVEAYKNALRQNPDDEEARYNLALAMQKLKQQQKNNKNKNNKDKNKQNQNKQKKNNKSDQKKDQKHSNKNQQQKDKQKQQNQNKNGQKPKQQNKQGQKRKTKLTPQQVKQILVALKNKEQKTQKKIKAKILKGKAKKHKQDKDW